MLVQRTVLCANGSHYTVQYNLALKSRRVALMKAIDDDSYGRVSGDIQSVQLQVVTVISDDAVVAECKSRGV